MVTHRFSTNYAIKQYYFSFFILAFSYILLNTAIECIKMSEMYVYTCRLGKIPLFRFNDSHRVALDGLLNIMVILVS